MTPQPQTEKIERANFNHLVGDIAWYGLPLAATTRFLSVYAIRLGAGAMELGLISALPALIVVITVSLGGWWSRRYPTAVQSLFWPALGQRLAFLLPFFAPFLPLQWQPLWLVLAVSFPALFQGISAVPFTVSMVEGIYPKRIMRLTSHRSLALNITIAISALILGFWLENAPFPLNYQIMFLLAFGVSLISLYHCISVRPVVKEAAVALVKPVAQPEIKPVRVSPWRSPAFKNVALVSVIIQLAFTIAIPIIPLYLVKRLGADEGFMAVFALVELAAGALGSVLAPRLANRIGTRPMIAVMIAGTAFNALIIALAPNLYVALIAAVFSGGCWTATAGIGLFQLFVDSTPDGEMAAYSTAYNQVNGLASFIGQMAGSLLVTGGINLFAVLIFGAALRLIAMPLIESSYFFRLKAFCGSRLRRQSAGQFQTQPDLVSPPALQPALQPVLQPEPEALPL
jgi:MFS family permease